MPYTNREKMYAAQKRHRIMIMEKLFELLSKNSCVDCEQNDPIVLDFDHKSKETKFKPVSKLLSGQYSWLSVENETKKCEIRCANCHRRKTYKDQNSWGKSKK